jgi:4-hydroxy-2-oxoheptanedioate aldolase
MTIRIPENVAKERLRQGKVAFGFGVRFSRSPEIARIASGIGYHWLFIDLEHNTMSIETAVQVCVAALDAGITAVVRVPGHERFHAQRILDGGAMGLWAPHIDTAEQARDFADNCLYSPKGSRGASASAALLNYENLPAREANAATNEHLLLIAQLESPTAIENADSIAAVDGIDVLSVGTSDLTLAMGFPNEFENPAVLDAYEHVIRVARKHGKWWRFGGVYDPDFQRRQIAMGSSMPVGGSDVSFMISAAREKALYLESLALASVK